MDQAIIGFIVVMICGIFSFVIGVIAGASGPDREQEAIDKGYARYHPKTGDWEWIEPDKAICSDRSKGPLGLD